MEEEAWLYKAVALTSLRRYEESLPAYRRALVLFAGTAPRRSVEAYKGMGIALMGLKRYQQALKAYSSAYAIASRVPMDQKTLVNLQEDITHLQQMLQQGPPDSGNNTSLPDLARWFPFLSRWRS